MQMGLQEKVPLVLKMLCGRSQSGQLEEQNPQSSGYSGSTRDRSLKNVIWPLRVTIIPVSVKCGA